MNLKCMVTITTKYQIFISEFPPSMTQAAFSHRFLILSLPKCNQLSLPAFISPAKWPLASLYSFLISRTVFLIEPFTLKFYRNNCQPPKQLLHF